MPSAPVQARSRETLRRILNASETLLETRAFDEISIVDITCDARVAAGSFYTRFDCKEELRQALFDRYIDDAQQEIAGRLDSGARRRLALPERVTEVVTVITDLFRRRRGIVRSISNYYRVNPERANAATRARLADVFEHFVQFVLGDGSEIHHEDPRSAVLFFVHLAAATCREKILFDDCPVPDPTRHDDALLVRELGIVGHAYLGSGSSSVVGAA